MKPLPLLLGLLAVAGAGTALSLHRQAGRDRATHAAALAQVQARFHAADSRARELTTQTTALQAQVSELDASLGEAKTKLTVTETRNVLLNRELTAAKQALAATAPQTEALRQEIAGLEETLSARQATIATLEGRLAAAQTPADPVPGPDAVLVTHRSRNASVASVGPSSAFVVLNYGATHGALPAQQLLIQRGTDVLARVLISDVRDHYSIAQVRPDSLRGALHKGDLAVLTE